MDDRAAPTISRKSLSPLRRLLPLAPLALAAVALSGCADDAGFIKARFTVSGQAAFTLDEPAVVTKETTSGGTDIRYSVAAVDGDNYGVTFGWERARVAKSGTYPIGLSPSDAVTAFITQPDPADSENILIWDVESGTIIFDVLDYDPANGTITRGTFDGLTASDEGSQTIAVDDGSFEITMP